MSLNPGLVPDFGKYFERHIVVDREGRGWLDYRLGTGGTAELTNIEVSRSHRRAGVGRTLLSRMIAELPSDVATVFAFTSEKNVLAHQWYQSLGFQLIRAPQFYASMGEDAYLCVKQLK